jgi:hypothetical protein
VVQFEKSDSYQGIALDVAEKVVNNAQSLPQALKRGHILNDLAARVELVPFPRPFELDFFRSIFSDAARAHEIIAAKAGLAWCDGGTPEGVP